MHLNIDEAKPNHWEPAPQRETQNEAVKHLVSALEQSYLYNEDRILFHFMHSNCSFPIIIFGT